MKSWNLFSNSSKLMGHISNKCHQSYRILFSRRTHCSTSRQNLGCLVLVIRTIISTKPHHRLRSSLMVLHSLLKSSSSSQQPLFIPRESHPNYQALSLPNSRTQLPTLELMAAAPTQNLHFTLKLKFNKHSFKHLEARILSHSLTTKRISIRFPKVKSQPWPPLRTKPTKMKSSDRLGASWSLASASSYLHLSMLSIRHLRQRGK